MLSWFRRREVSTGNKTTNRASRSGFSRIAVGDLLMDLELPESFHRGYEESGTMVAWDDSHRWALRISGITATPKVPGARNLCIEDLAAAAAERGCSVVKVSDSVAYYAYAETADWGDGEGINEFWIAGFGNRKLVITLSFAGADRASIDVAQLRSEVEQAIRSVALTYPEIPRDGDRPQIFDLADSQRCWFEHHRADMARRIHRELGYEGEGLIPLEVMDEFWSRFIAAPPESSDAVNAILNGMGVLFGDHLVRAKNFEWIILSDSYGVCLALVTLRGKANLNTDPFNYVAKRWDRKEPRFLVSDFQALCDLADEWAARG